MGTNLFYTYNSLQFLDEVKHLHQQLFTQIIIKGQNNKKKLSCSLMLTVTKKITIYFSSASRFQVKKKVTVSHNGLFIENKSLCSKTKGFIHNNAWTLSSNTPASSPCPECLTNCFPISSQLHSLINDVLCPSLRLTVLVKVSEKSQQTQHYKNIVVLHILSPTQITSMFLASHFLV